MAEGTEAKEPQLAIAALCEKLLDEKDNVISLIRVVDRTTISTGSPAAPEEMPAVPLSYWLCVAFRSCGFIGVSHVKIEAQSPSGKARVIGELDAPFSAENPSVNIKAEVSFQTDETGWHYFDVYLDGRRITRVPLLVIYERTGVQAAG